MKKNRPAILLSALAPGRTRNPTRRSHPQTHANPRRPSPPHRPLRSRPRHHNRPNRIRPHPHQAQIPLRPNRQRRPGTRRPSRRRPNPQPSLTDRRRNVRSRQVAAIPRFGDDLPGNRRESGVRRNETPDYGPQFGRRYFKNGIKGSSQILNPSLAKVCQTDTALPCTVLRRLNPPPGIIQRQVANGL